MTELLEQLRGIADRLPCCTVADPQADCGTATCDKAKLEALIDEIRVRWALAGPVVLSL